jgi:hypothetical protein
MSDEEEEFKWDDDETVVIKPVQAIAVYRNRFGHVVIRQERASFQEDDPYVVVPESELRRLIEALNKQLV